MRKSSIFTSVIALLAIFFLFILGITSLPISQDDDLVKNAEEDTLEPLEHPTYSFVNPVKGMQDAALTIYEFGDYTCEACAEVEQTLNLMQDEFPLQVKIVWKDFPHLGFQQEGLYSAMAARCAGLQGAFWEYHDILLANQLSINRPSLNAFAAEIRLDIPAFETCLENEETRHIVERDFEEGLRLGVDSTPYFFIGERRVSGGLNYEQLRGFIVTELERIRAAGDED